MAISDYAVSPYLSWGMWVARCPRPGCANAERRGRCDDGSAGGLEAARFTCRASHGGCGLACRVDWPHNITDIEALVLARPIPMTRNWSPGESLRDLLVENIAHGLMPNDELEIRGDRLSRGELASWARLEIGA